MDFYQHQDRARSRTTLLVLLYSSAVLGMGGLVAGSVHVMLAPADPSAPYSDDHWLFVTGALGLIWGTILLGSLYKTAQLSRGGSKVAEMLGGRLMLGSTTDSLERRCLNVVEEMAIASGLPVPATYVLDSEEGINAFAAGWSHDDAVIGVTRGALETLNREQLQGVIAHEFSHILNRDCSLNMRLLGVLHGIILLSILGRIVLRSGRGARRKGGAQILMVGLGLWLLGSLGAFIAGLIQAAVSRQREFLADASAVQFTRNPQGLAGALAAIATGSSALESPRGKESSHLLFGEPAKSRWLSLSASHPPLQERITRIMPSWDGAFQELAHASQAGSVREQAAEEMMQSPNQTDMSLAALNGLSAVARSAPDPERVSASPSMIPPAGSEPPPPVGRAQRLLAQLPAPLKAAAETPFSARALLLAWAIDGNPEKMTAHFALLDDDPALRREVERLTAILQRLEGQHRLPLFEIALGTLAQLSPPQAKTFCQRMDALLAQLSPRAYRSYCMAIMTVRRLRERPRAGKKVMLIKPAVETVLSLLVFEGHDTHEQAARAYEAGCQAMGRRGHSLQLMEPGELSVQQLDGALSTLLRLPTQTRADVLRAAELMASHDGVVRPAEAELLRTIATCLGVGHGPD